jgi:Uma2 family endonuclease
MKLVIELPPREELLRQNRLRWAQVVADRTLANLPFRVETNRDGVLLMTPPPSGDHSDRQSQILLRLNQELGGRVLAECPVSTIDGVRAADVGWYSVERFAQVKGQVAFDVAPEICVEVISPSNTDSEMASKKLLYFEAGAQEVWFCRVDSRMQFYCNQTPDAPINQSRRCPNFPSEI